MANPHLQGGARVTVTQQIGAAGMTQREAEITEQADSAIDRLKEKRV